MKITKNLCLVLLGILPVLSRAQLNQVSIYPPESASLMRSVDFPVGHLNGIPDIRIPLHTIKVGSLTFPLELSFHMDNFIRANQMPGSAGAGWSLSSELQVSRTINGKDDLRPEGYCSASTIPANYNSATSPYPLRTKQQKKQMVDGITEEEPDKFYYQLLGKSGAFYFQKQSNGSFKPIPVPFNGVKIEYSSGLFTIYDTDGTIYSFSAANCDWTDDGPSVTHTMAWKCANIKNAAETQEITFSYTTPYQYLSTSFKDRIEVYDDINSNVGFESPYGVYNGGQFWQFTGPKFARYAGQYSTMAVYDELNGTFQSLGSYGQGSPSQTYNNISNRPISQITFRGGSIVFSYLNTPTSNNRQLSSIQINNTAGLIKTINFTQSYTGSDGMAFVNNKYNHSRKLDMVQIGDQKYSFTYGFERQYGNVSDFWGYVAGPPADYSTVPYQQIDLSMGNCIRWFDGLAYEPFNPYISLTTMIGEAWSLENIFHYTNAQQTAMTITYPTGGRAEFIVGQNRFRDPIDATIKGTGGYRIERIKYFDGVSQNPVKEKIYKYGPNEDGTGIIKGQPSFDPYSGNCFLDETNVYRLADGTQHNSTRKRTYLSGSTRSLTFSNGAPVNYNEVAEYDMDLGQTTGKTVYKYDLYDYSPEYTSPTDPFPLENDEWNIGMPDSVIQYKYQNGQFKWVKRKNMDYNMYTDPYQIFCGRTSLRGNHILVEPSSTLTQDWLTENFGNMEYKSKGIKTGVMQLVREDEAQRDNNGNIITSQVNYFYNNPDPSVVTRTENIGSDGITTTQYTTYPRDYASGSFINDLVTKNIVAVPIEKITRKNGKIISGQISTYNSNGTVASSYQIESNQLNDTGFRLSNRTVTGSYPPYGTNATFNPDLSYIQKLNVTWDNTYLNPIQVSPTNNISISYIWGYSNSFPVVKAENMDNATLTNRVSQALSGTGYYTIEALLSSITTLPNSSWTLFNQNLRSNLPANTLISTYTYKPLVGMSSQTAPNGVTTYYEYDLYGHLKLVKNDDTHITNRSTYNYKP